MSKEDLSPRRPDLPGDDWVDLGSEGELDPEVTNGYLASLRVIGRRAKPGTKIALAQLADGESIVTTFGGLPARIDGNHVTIDGERTSLRLPANTAFGPGSRLRFTPRGQSQAHTYTFGAEVVAVLRLVDSGVAASVRRYVSSNLLERVVRAERNAAREPDINRPTMLSKNGSMVEVGDYTDKPRTPVSLERGQRTAFWDAGNRRYDIAEDRRVTGPTDMFGTPRAGRIRAEAIIVGEPAIITLDDGGVLASLAVVGVASRIEDQHEVLADIKTDGAKVPAGFEGQVELRLPPVDPGHDLFGH